LENGNKKLLPLPPKGWTWLKSHASEAEYMQLRLMNDREQIREFVRARVHETVYPDFVAASRTDEEVAADKARSRTIGIGGDQPTINQLIYRYGSLDKIPLWKLAEVEKPADPDELVPCPEVLFDKDPHAL